MDCKDSEIMKILFGIRRWRPGFSAAQQRIEQRIREAVDEWIEQKGYTRLLPTLNSLAEDIGVPSDQLIVHIRKRTRKSVMAWRKELRIREARRLLLDYPEMPISIVGLMVGIDDKSNFKRQFAQLVGMPPRVWREKHLRRS